jgi:hypothetical protein
MKRILFPSMALALIWPLVEPTAAEPVASKPTRGAAIQPTATGKLAGGRDEEVRERLDGLALQIHQINAHIANLGRRNAAALRFLTVSLAAYQRTWAELTRDEVDFGHEGGHEAVAAFAGAQP